MALAGFRYVTLAHKNILDQTDGEYQAVNEKGETFIDDVSAGDVWFFPP